jgi:hypothetical protein
MPAMPDLFAAAKITIHAIFKSTGNRKQASGVFWVLLRSPVACLAQGCGSVASRKSGFRLSKVSSHRVDHFISRQHLLRIRLSFRIKHMVPDMTLQEFSH